MSKEESFTLRGQVTEALPECPIPGWFGNRPKCVGTLSRKAKGE